MIISRDLVIPLLNHCLQQGYFFYINMNEIRVSGLSGWRNFHKNLGYERNTASAPLLFPLHQQQCKLAPAYVYEVNNSRTNRKKCRFFFLMYPLGFSIILYLAYPWYSYLPIPSYCLQILARRLLHQSDVLQQILLLFCDLYVGFYFQRPRAFHNLSNPALFKKPKALSRLFH